MDTTASDYPGGDLRVSDANRERALSELSEAFQAGRITASELDQRSGQVLGARTGKELATPLADLPRDQSLPAPPSGLNRAHRVLAARITMGASAVTAIALAAVAAANAMGNDLSPQKRELAREILAREGLTVPRGLPATPGSDWVGTITPAAIAVLLVVLIVFLRATRADRS